MPQPVLPFVADPAVSPPDSRGAKKMPPPCSSGPTLDDPAHLPSRYAPVFVQHPRARRYVVRVTEDGTVRVTIPRRGSRREAVAFAEGQREWIEKQRRRVAQARNVPADLMPADEQRLLRARAERELPPRLLALAAEFGLSVTRISVKNQRRRWGSCSRRGHICLNWRLVAMPDWVRDYVLVHELMHLKRMDHSPSFWTLVAASCPSYEDARRWLRGHRDLLSH